MSILSSLIKAVDKNLEKVSDDTDASDLSITPTNDDGSISNDFDIDPVQFDIEQLADSGTPPSAVATLKDTMSGTSPNGIGSQVKSMSKMAESIEPIVKNFDSVLVCPEQLFDLVPVV
jgi:hypothetical protein